MGNMPTPTSSIRVSDLNVISGVNRGVSINQNKTENNAKVATCGGLPIKSLSKIEQTFGGLHSNLKQVDEMIAKKEIPPGK